VTVTPVARRRLWLVLAGVLLMAAHVGLVNYFVPFENVFGVRPLTGADYDLHIGQVYRVVEGLEGWGKSWVYDVKLVAGQPEGTITDSGSKGWELWTYAMHQLGATRPIAFNTFVLLVMLACPLLVFAAARAFELPYGASLLAAAMASSVWFFDSYVHWIWFVGMISWAGASCLALLTLGLFYRLMRTQHLAFALPCGLCLGIGHLIHPYSFFVLAPPMAAVYFRGFRSRRRSVHAAVVGIAIFAVAINAFWLITSLAHWHYILDSGFFARGALGYFVSDFFEILRGPDTGVIGVRSGFRILYFGLSAAWLVLERRRSDPRVLPIAVGMLSALALAYLAAYLPGGPQVQPYRNLPPAILLSTIPAAAFLSQQVSGRMWQSATTGVRALLLVAAVALFQHLSQQILFFIPRSLPAPDSFPDGFAFPLSKYGFLSYFPPDQLHYGLPHPYEVEPGLAATAAWLSENIPSNSRVLVEGAALGERLAWSSPFEVIGGFRERNVAHAYANYFRSHDRRPATPSELGEYLRTFGISWIVLCLDHPEFDNAPGVVAPVRVIAGYRVYRTVAPVGRVLAGAGTVRARTNEIDVRDSDPNRPLVLSYHFHEALRCAPECSIERENHPLDRVGFIRVPSPHPRAFRIFNSYKGP
jgi:hypothetical protein